MAARGWILVVSFAIFNILEDSNAAITPLVKTYTATIGSDFQIPWTFDNELQMSTVDWTYQSSLSATPTTIMSKSGTAAATVFNNYNVEHDGNGNISLQKVRMDNAGIYFCVVAYTLASSIPPVTGTATLSVAEDSGNEDELSEEDKAGIAVGCTVFVLIICGVVGIILYKKTVKPQWLDVTAGHDVTFHYTCATLYPAWIGPEKCNDANLRYNSDGNKNFDYTRIPEQKKGRLDWGSDNKSLVIKKVAVSDTGLYKCNRARFYLSVTEGI